MTRAIEKGKEEKDNYPHDPVDCFKNLEAAVLNLQLFLSNYFHICKDELRN